MLQDLDKVRLDLVDLSDNFVRIVQVSLFMEKLIKEFQGRRPEHIFRRGDHQFSDEEIFKKFQQILICNCFKNNNIIMHIAVYEIKIYKKAACKILCLLK